MKKTQTSSDKLDKERQKQLQEIADIEKRIKNWTFDMNEGVGHLPQVMRIENNIKDVLEEENASVVLVEAEKLLQIMTNRYIDATLKLKVTENQILMLNNDIQNKIIHKMDSEDIRYSIYKKLITKEKVEILLEAEDTYKAICESLESLKDLKQPEGNEGGKKVYLPVKRIIHSEFYTCKVKARLSYESCYTKLMSLNRKMMAKDTFDQAVVDEFVRQKAIAMRSIYSV